MLHTFELARDALSAAPPARRRDATASARSPRIELSVTSDLGALEATWRAFEQQADCTPFQTFDWLSAWQEHIGAPAGVIPVIVVGRFADHTPAFILPLAIEQTRLYRRLVFLGRALGDYNAPLLAPGFAETVPSSGRSDWWQSIRALIGRHPQYRHHLVLFDKMPEQIGGQANPMVALPTALHPSRAYRTALAGNWDTFYAAKRSSNTRRRDRTKRKKLGELGDVRIVTPESPSDISRTLATLYQQKSQALIRMGVPDLFARPGYRDFFTAVATRPDSIVHVSRVDVGDLLAAANLGIRFHGSYYHVLASYDDGPASRFGPGALHLHELMRYAIEQGSTVFDFTIGDEGYKLDWADEALVLRDHVSAASWRGAIFAFETKVRLRAKQAIKQSRWLWPLATRLRARLLGTRVAPSEAD